MLLSRLGLIFETSISLQAGSTWLICWKRSHRDTVADYRPMWCLRRIAGHISPAAVAACTKCQCSAEAAQVTHRRSRNAALSEKRVCRRQVLHGQWSADTKIAVLACQNQSIQVECLRRVLKQLQSTQSPIQKPKSSNSAKCKVKQCIAWNLAGNITYILESSFFVRYYAHKNSQPAGDCTFYINVLRALLPELWQRNWRVHLGKILMQPEGKARLCNGLPDSFRFNRRARRPKDAATHPRFDGVLSAAE